MATELTPMPLPDDYTSPEQYRAENRMWWHKRIADELATIAAETGFKGYSVRGVAGNVGMSALDVTRYVRQMLLWGEVVVVPVEREGASGPWVGLAQSATV